MAINGNRQQKLDNLTPAQRRALVALLAESTIKDAAKSAGIGERTLHRFFDDPAFVQALRAAEARALDLAVRQLIRLANDATAAIEAIMNDQNVSAGVRLRAADIILSRLLQLRELANLESRITALEAMLNESKEPG